MSATHFSGPLLVGTLTTGETNGPNQGYVSLQKAVSMASDGTNVVNRGIFIPAGSRISSFEVDVLTAYDSATSATLTIGTSSGDTKYAGSINVKTAGRASITFTTAQLAAMNSMTVTGAYAATDPLVVFTITPVGATTTGFVRATIKYAQQ